MRGITEERLIERLESLKGYGKDYILLLELIQQECKELIPWQSIETAPKDRELLLYTEKYGRIIGKWFEDTNRWTANCIAIYPTHYQELPEDPK